MSAPGRGDPAPPTLYERLLRSDLGAQFPERARVIAEEAERMAQRQRDVSSGGRHLFEEKEAAA